MSFTFIFLYLVIKLESVPAQVEEEAPAELMQESETPAQQHFADMKDDEGPMEQEESNPVIKEDTDTVSQVRLSYSYFLHVLVCK